MLPPEKVSTKVWAPDSEMDMWRFLVFLVDFQLLELVQACTSMYKHPQEKCGNTDEIIYKDSL